MTSSDNKDHGSVPGLLEILTHVPDPRGRRGRRYLLTFVLAIDGTYLRGVADGQVRLLSAMLHQAAFDAIQASGPGRTPDHEELDRSHGRIIHRSIWVTTADCVDFPQVARVVRIRRDGYDADGQPISKQVVHAVTSLTDDQASAQALAGITRGQWGIESVHWIRDTAYAEDANTGYAGDGPQVMATLRNLAISLLYLAGVTEITFDGRLSADRK